MPRVKTSYLVTVEVQVEGWWPADVERYRNRLTSQADCQFPSLNVTELSGDGSYSTKCLGVRRVRKVSK